MRCEVSELQTPRAAPDYILDGVFGYAGSPGGSVPTDRPENSSRRDRCRCQPPVHGTLHPDRHGYGPDVVALADKVNNNPMALSNLYVFLRQGRQLGSAQAAAEQDRYHSDVSDMA
jgi:hypothetical protein